MGEERVKVNGLITYVNKYHNGLIIRIKQRKKVFVPREILRKSGLLLKPKESEEFDQFVFLSGMKITAIGKHYTYYGGIYKNYIIAEEFILENKFVTHLDAEETRNRVTKILKEVGLQRFAKNEVLLQKIISVPSFLFKLHIQSKVDFYTAVTLYKLIKRSVVFPVEGIVSFCRELFWKAYSNKRKLLVSIEDAERNIKNFTVVSKNALVDVIKKSFKVFKIDEKLYYTTWDFYYAVKKVVQKVCELAGVEYREDYITNFFKEGKCVQFDENSVLEIPEISEILLFHLLKEKKALVLTGEGGTGKTTAINRVYDLLRKRGEYVFLLAPTHAAKGELRDGKTVSLVNKRGIPPTTTCIFIDECSMINVTDLSKLLSKVDGQKIIFAGAFDQNLPPRGYETYKSIILPIFSMKKASIVKLTATHRFKEKKIEVIPFIDYKHAKFMVKRVLLSFGSSGSWVMITPRHIPPCGTVDLNKLAKLSLGKNPQKFEEGDLVILTENIVKDGMIIAANKESGVVREVKDSELVIQLDRRNKVVQVPKSCVAFGYAIEYYSSQGKEYDYTIVFVNGDIEDSEKFEREWNTITTRARKKTVVFVPKVFMENQLFCSFLKREKNVEILS